jgi:hypothetical protein
LQRESIAVAKREKGHDKLSIEFSIALSLESSRMAVDASSKWLLDVLTLLPNNVPVSPSPDFRRQLFLDIPDIARGLNPLVRRSWRFASQTRSGSR